MSKVITLLVFCLLMSGPALAQEKDSATATRDSVASPPDRPMVRGGVYDKPFQTRLFGRTAIGGYAEAHARYQKVDGLQDETGFSAKRLNLFVNSRVSDFVRFGAEIEFEDGAEEILLEYAAIDFRIHPSLTLRGGMLLSPLGKFNLSHDSPLNEFTDRPLVSTELLGVALSEPGIGAFGQFRTSRTGRFTYEAYLTNGFHEGLILDSEDGTRIPLGRRNFEDNNGSPAIVGRLAWSPRFNYEIGFSAHHGAYNTFMLEGARVDQTRNLTLAAIDAEASVFGVRLTGEAARVKVNVPAGLEGIYASKQHGVYVEAVREFWRGRISTMRKSSFAAKVRWDYVDFNSDLDGTSIGQISAGFNFRPTEDSALKLDYVRGRGRDEFNNLGQHAFLLASIATYF